MSVSSCIVIVVSALVLLYGRVGEALPTISAKGSKFFTSDGDQFFLKGVVYQPSSGDVNNLVDGDQCKIDATSIAELGANLVSVYSVDPTLNHDDCMKAFEEEGIYVMLVMSTPDFAINRVDPDWTMDLRNAFADVVDGFQAYDNLFGFFAGTEIINDVNTTAVAPYAKAVIADMKAYRDLMRYREIPIGYAATDVNDIRLLQQEYFACGNSSTAADFYGLNRYSWAGENSSFTTSGYDVLYDEAEDYPIPIIFSETGWNVETGDTPYRIFDDQEALLGRQMNDRYSGSIIYEWAQDVNNYGLVSYSDSSSLKGPATTMGDYSRLKEQWAALTPVGVKASDYNPTMTALSCPDFTSGTWSVSADAALPTLGLSGFTAPTGSAARSGQTTTGSGNAALETNGSNGSSQNGTSSGSNGVAVGAIVGGVIGGLAIIILSIVGVCFLRRRRRQRGSGLTSRDGPANAESDKMVAGPEEQSFGGYYGPKRHHETSGAGQVAELDPAKGHVTTMGANEMFGGYGQMGELQNTHQDRPQEMPQHGNLGDNAPPSLVSVSRTPSVRDVNGSSQLVQAQRRMEVDWLESEEARLRQQRELILSQSRGL